MVFPELKYGSSKIYCGKYSDCYHRSCSPGDPDGGCIVSAGHEVFFHEVGRESSGSGTTKDCAADNKTNDKTNDKAHQLIFSGTVLKSGTSIIGTMALSETGCRKNPGR